MSDYKSIKAQIAKLEKQAEELRKKEIKGVILKIQGHIQEYGLTAQDLGFKTVAPAKKLKTGSVLAAKYRDPLSGKTWTGRGKPPLWIAEAFKAGKKDDYLIDKPEAPAAKSTTPSKQKTASPSKAKVPVKKSPKKVPTDTVTAPATESTPAA